MKDKNAYRERLAGWLREQGHKATVEMHDQRFASVLFRSRGIAFVARVDELDRGFLFLTLPYPLPAGIENRPAAEELARALEHQLKLVKIALDWENRRVEFNAEQLVVDCDVAPIFWRCTDGLVEASERFFEQASELAANGAAQKFLDEVGRDLGLAPG